MPKIVNYDEQKKKIANSVLEIVRTKGLSQVTVRNTACEAKLSVGALRHYFPNQAELIKYTMNLIVEQVSERISSDPVYCKKQKISVESAVDILMQLIAVNENRQTEMKTWLSFCTESFYKPEFKVLCDKMYDMIYQFIYHILSEMKSQNLIKDNIDFNHEVRQLHILIDGLSLHRVIRPDRLLADNAKSILKGWLDNLVK